MSSLSPNPAVGGSEKHLISPAMSTFRVMICLALAGCSHSVEPSEPVEFVFPLEAGTTWHYAYSRSFAHIITHTETRGQEVWRSTGPVSPNAIRILLSRIDTTTTYPTYVGGDTTTVIAKLDTSFSIMVTPDSLFIQYYQLAFRGNDVWMPFLFQVPRFVWQSADTLTLRYGESRATYVSGKGLIFWKNYNGTMFYWDERLILESMSP
jgi:hypothetical protein